jgi:hypothetical protein
MVERATDATADEMTGLWIATGALALALVAIGAGAFLALAMGRLHLDLGWGRSRHPLGPLRYEIAAPRELVYEILSAPYLGRARSDTIDVLAAGESLVVAAHLTKVHFYEARTVEAIELEPPSRMGFRHLTGPVPEATEEFRLDADGEATVLHYDGNLGIDFFFLGRIAGRHWVVPQWNRAVAEHLDEVKRIAEQRAERAHRRSGR